ncbi:hypothetical protein, partial [Corynebacterium sphenisci]|uniref:hypothetical protein n=1 Tax=Corynebacterium sphenisci TaxID=191493 RepID=UPI0026DFE04D
AVLCEERWPGRVRLGWTGGAEPEASVAVAGIPDTEIAAAVRDSAIAASGSDGWARATALHPESKRPYSPLAPRFTKIDPAKYPDGWASYQQSRWKILDNALNHDRYGLLELITGLGEAAHWQYRDASNFDSGASRWDMRPRMGGRDLVTDQVKKLGLSLMEWTPAEILDGLTGRRLKDTFSKDPSTSRAASGFRPPGPTDNSIAWCALWGIALLPVEYRASGISITPAAWPPSAFHPEAMFLAALSSPVTPSRYRTVLTSRALAEIGRNFGPTDGMGLDSPSADQAFRWLRQRGSLGVLRFPVVTRKAGLSRERLILEGTPCRP